MGRLADLAFSDAGLREAWAEVRANDSVEGRRSRGIERFEATLDDEIARLVADLAWGAYEPMPLTEVVLEDDPNRRVLQIPSVRDRVVERAVLDAVTPRVDPALGTAAYAYRPGLGVQDAVQAVAALRDEGLRWAMRTDVDDCFPSIPVGYARRRLGALVDDSELLRVVDLLLARPAVGPGGRRAIVRGVPQGCALSPLMANLVLVDLDRALLDEGFPVVRYADDLVVVTDDEADAWEAARVAAHAVEELGMALGSEDTRVMSFDEGFTFLGEDFGPRYPLMLDSARIEEPQRKVLYAGLQGSRVRIGDGRVVVESPDDAELLDVPSGAVRRVVCFGAIGVSAGLRSWALSSDVDIVLASRRGSYLGSIVSESGAARADRIRRQVAVQGSPEGLTIAKAIIEAKIAKQIVVLRRFGRRANAQITRDAISAMEQISLMIPDCGTTEEAMGLEGAAAAAYFPAFGSLLPPELQFEVRSRQPPLDVANSALSFLYTVLLGECVTALHACGLDPGLGILHADHERRPSLALDLLEEFRPLVADQVVASCARLGALKAEHGRSEEGRAGVLLTRAGREAILDAYERRMLTTTRGALPDFAGTIRRHLYRQAQRLHSAVADPAATWTGLSWR